MPGIQAEHFHQLYRDKFWQALDLHRKTLQWERSHNPTFPESLEHHRLKRGGYLYSFPRAGYCFNYKIHQLVLPSFYPPVNKHSNGKSPSWIGIHLQMCGFSIAMLDYLSVFLCKPFLWLPNSICKKSRLCLLDPLATKNTRFLASFLGESIALVPLKIGKGVSHISEVHFMKKNCTEFFSGLWFQPIWKILVKLGIFPRVKIKNLWNHHLDCSFPPKQLRPFARSSFSREHDNLSSSFAHHQAPAKLNKNRTNRFGEPFSLKNAKLFRHKQTKLRTEEWIWVFPKIGVPPNHPS